MSCLRLKVLDADAQLQFQYLPYGMSTIEMKLEGDEDVAEGFIYPEKRADRNKKVYMGYADGNQDFLVLWGGGKLDGLQITEKNVKGRLFLQLLHLGHGITCQNLTLHHSKLIKPISKIALVPAIENENVSKTTLSQQGNVYKCGFEGNMIPSYYSRWFPPKPSLSEKARISYYSIGTPPITMKFKTRCSETQVFIDSEVEIFFEEKKMVEITGDLKYSWPHAELFTLFGDNDYLVLRVWFYWTKGNFSKNTVLGGAALLDARRKPQDEETRRGLWESFDIECPDVERFDFLIDVKHRAVTWVGTDFHYQEFWSRVDDVPFVKARIANDVETLCQVFKKIKERFNPPENFNPMEMLKRKIIEQEREQLEFEKVSEPVEFSVSNIDQAGMVTYRAEGFTRKHIPFVKNTRVAYQLVSSVVTA